MTTFAQKTATIEEFDRHPLLIDREEMAGLTALLADNKPPSPSGFRGYEAPKEAVSIPIRMTYGNVIVHKFYTDMQADPRHTFKIALDYAEKKIDELVSNFETEDSSKTAGLRSWQITNGFTTFNVCLHCYTQYDQSDFVAEDIATHRVVVSMTANFDASKVYKSDVHATEVFAEMNVFYENLKLAFSV